MIAPQTFNNYPEFGSAALKCCPDATRYANGYIQGDVLPAEHVNWFLSGATVGVSALQLGMDSIEKEMQTLMCCSGIAACATCYNQIYNAISYQIQQSAATKAPVAHASSATTYGVGNASCYGHLKISDTYTSVLSECSGVAASQQALVCVYNSVTTKAGLGNTAGCALGTASAGVAGTAARSDHVHPLQSGIPNTGFATCCFTWVSTSSSFAGAPSEWAHYLISSHGDGSSYYNYIIREPFGGVPQYSRMINGTQSQWYNFITSENIGSQYVCWACNANTAAQANVADNACCLGGYQLSDANVPSTIPLRTCDGFIYASFYNTSGAGDDDMSRYPGSSLAFIDTSGWLRKTPPSYVCVGYAGCACIASYSQAGYLRISTCSYIGGNQAAIFYCAANLTMPWLTQNHIVLNGIKAGSSNQFDLSTFQEITNKITTADGKTLGLLCVDQQWHHIATCVDATGGIFTNDYYAEAVATLA